MQQINKQEKHTHTQTTVWWLPKGMGVRGSKRIKGVKYIVIEKISLWVMGIRCDIQMQLYT